MQLLTEHGAEHTAQSIFCLVHVKNRAASFFCEGCDDRPLSPKLERKRLLSQLQIVYTVQPQYVVAAKNRKVFGTLCEHQQIILQMADIAG